MAAYLDEKQEDQWSPEDLTKNPLLSPAHLVPESFSGSLGFSKAKGLTGLHRLTSELCFAAG